MKYRIFSNEMEGYVSEVLDRKPTNEEYSEKEYWSNLMFNEDIENALLFDADFLMNPEHEIWLYSKNKKNITTMNIDVVIFEDWNGKTMPTYIVKM